MHNKQLNPQEEKQFLWFQDVMKQFPESVKTLSPEDQEAFNKSLKYNEHPQKVTGSRENLVHVLFDKAQEHNVVTPYPEEDIKKTVVKVAELIHSKTIQKPHDEHSAHRYVYAQLLTKEEQDCFTREVFINNKAYAQLTLYYFAELVTKELAELNLINKDNKTQLRKTIEIYNEKQAALNKAYGKSPQQSNTNLKR